MKRIGILISGLLLLGFFCELKSQNSQLITSIQKVVEQTNSQCPIYYDEGNGVTLLSVRYENNIVIYDYKVDRILDASVSNMDNIKTSMIYMLKGEAETYPESKKFFNNLIKTGGKILYKYHTSSGKSFSVEISNNELRNAIK